MVYSILSVKLYIYSICKKKQKFIKFNYIIIHKKFCYSATFLVSLNFYIFFKKTAFLFIIKKLC